MGRFVFRHILIDMKPTFSILELLLVAELRIAELGIPELGIAELGIPELALPEAHFDKTNRQ